MWAAFRFSLAYNGTGFSAQAYSGLADQQGFGSAIWLSVQLAIVTTIFELAIMVPTTVYIHLRVPRLRRVMDFVTSLPLVIPPVVLILGVLTVAPSRLKATPFLLALEYVVLAVPSPTGPSTPGSGPSTSRPWWTRPARWAATG